MAAAHGCFKTIPDQNIIMAEQNLRLATSHNRMSTVSGTIGSLSGTSMLSIADNLNIVASQSTRKGTYVIPTLVLFVFLEDLLLSTAKDRRFLHGKVQYHLICTMVDLLLFAYTQLSPLQIWQATKSSALLQVISPVLFSQVLGPAAL